MKLRHVGVWSVARMAAILQAIIGLIIGGIVAAMSLLGAAFSRMAGGDRAGPFAFIFGFGAIFFMPVIYGFLGGVCGAFGAWLYNLLAGAVGGIELDLGA